MSYRDRFHERLVSQIQRNLTDIEESIQRLEKILDDDNMTEDGYRVLEEESERSHQQTVRTVVMAAYLGNFQ